MAIADDVSALAKKANKLERQLDAVLKAVAELPHAPPGFGDSAVDRIVWMVKFVKDNWAVRQEVEEWKKRALAAERAVDAYAAMKAIRQWRNQVT